MKITLVSAHGSTEAHDRSSLLDADAREAARTEANAWIKRLRLVRYGDATMRERFTYRNDSLWWFTEIYLHKMKRLDAAVETVLALEAAQNRGARAMVVETDDETRRLAAAAFGRAHRLDVTCHGHAAQPSSTVPGLLVGVTATLSRARRGRLVVPARHPKVAAFVHTAFWRSAEVQHEGYIGPVLDALASRVGEDLFFVGLGPRRNFRARRWWDPFTRPNTAAPIAPIEQLAPTTALKESLALWRQRARLAREITTGADIREAAMFRGCDLWPILERELQDAARVQWPWSARAMDEAGAALDALQPQAMLTYAEAGGWGRALVLEARRRSIPSAGIQHGFIYRHWLNYTHEPDELLPSGADKGFPLPDETLLYDEYAAEYLRTAGHFPDARLTVTGNARLEALLAKYAACATRRDDLRRDLGVSAGQTLVVLAAKFSEIGDELPALVQAAGSIAGLRLVIKTHPAETADVYAPVVERQAHAAVVGADRDLAELLAAADALVTKNSTVAIDALVLGVPAVVIGLPNNLSPFVAAGVMAGGDDVDGIGQALRSVLYDLQVRQALLERAGRFAVRFRLRPDPGAADRAAAAVLALAGGRQPSHLTSSIR